MSEVLIAGCGDLGAAAGSLLAAAGARVWGLRRDPSALPGALEPLAADLLRPATLRRLPPVSTLVYCPTPAQHTEAAYRDTYVAGLRHLLAALEGAPLERALLVSSTSVYGQDDGRRVDEDSPCEPRGFSGRVMLEAEHTLCSAARGWTPTVLRLAGIYGPGRTRLIARAAAGGAVQRDPVYWTNRIHRDDAAALIAHLLGLDRPPPVAIGVDDEPAPLWDVIRWLAGRLGAPPPLPATGDGGNKRLSNARIRAGGFRPRYPSYRDGYGPLVAAWLDAGGNVSDGKTK